MEHVLVRVYILAEALATATREMAESLDLTTPRLELLYLLRLRGQLIQREIAHHLDCTPRQVTALVDALSATGHVERVTPADDRRRKVVRLTSMGGRIVDSLAADRNALAHTMFGSFDPADVDVFERFVEAAIEGMGVRKTDEPQKVTNTS